MSLPQEGDRAACDLTLATHDGLDLLWPGLLQLGELVEGSRRPAAAALKRFLELRRQGQKRKMVGDARQVDAEASCDLGIGFAGICTRAHEPGEIERRQTVTFLVLGDLSVGIMGPRTDDDRDGLEPGLPRGTQTLRAEENSVATGLGNRARHDRLEDAAQCDVSGQLGDLLVRELGSRVLGILLDGIDRHEKRGTISP